MPAALTYPGVYVEEIPSGVRTIVGVATSITAFVGRTPTGPVNKAITINSYGDFDAIFGGLADEYPLTYAVRDFFNNGGSQAIVVRLFSAGGAANNGVATFSAGSLNLVASSPGTWGNNLSATVDTKNITADVAGQYAQYGLTVADLFNLTIKETVNGQTIATEVYYAVSAKSTAGPQRVDRVLAADSLLARVAALPISNPVPPPAPPAPPAPGAAGPAAGGGAAAPGAGAAAPPGPGAAAAPALPPPPPPPPPPTGANSAALGLADYVGDQKSTGIYALEQADLFNLLCIPPDVRGQDLVAGVWVEAMSYFQNFGKRAMLLVDPPIVWGTPAGKLNLLSDPATAITSLNIFGTIARNAALFYPRIKQADPLRNGQTDEFPPSGTIAGVMARTDTQRGVWKAPAGIDAALNGSTDLEIVLTDRENGNLNPVGINCLRSFPAIGEVVWGARTMRGADILADDYKYIPIRRLALFIEESLYRGTKWVVFEPNDEPLWAQIRLNVGAFMQDMFRQGAFQGTSPRDAYFVKCDKQTTTANDQDLGIVNIVVGFAPLKPAEFVVLQIQQMQGDIQT